MSLIRWEPFLNMEKLSEKDFPFLPFLTDRKLGWDLAVDMYEEKGNLIAEMNLPGIDPDKVEVTFQNGNLKIAGKREEKKETNEKDFYCKEIRRGEFEKIVALPEKVKGDKIEAHCEKGVLKIVMPMVEAKMPENIKVKVH